MAVCRSGKDWLGGSHLGVMVEELSASDQDKQLQAKCCRNNRLPHTTECRPQQVCSAASTFVSTQTKPTCAISGHSRSSKPCCLLDTEALMRFIT